MIWGFDVGFFVDEKVDYGVDPEAGDTRGFLASEASFDRRSQLLLIAKCAGGQATRGVGNRESDGLRLVNWPRGGNRGGARDLLARGPGAPGAAAQGGVPNGADCNCPISFRTEQGSVFDPFSPLLI